MSLFIPSAQGWSKFSYFLLIALVLSGILFRFAFFHGVFFAEERAPDYYRDFLVANHIVRYGEIPLTGPDNKFGSTLSSPFYFYFLAMFLLINDNIVFLGVINIFLQFFLLILVYFLARNLFGEDVAIIAVLLVSFMEWSLIVGPQQPNYMQFLNVTVIGTALVSKNRNSDPGVLNAHRRISQKRLFDQQKNAARFCAK